MSQNEKYLESSLGAYTGVLKPFFGVTRTADVSGPAGVKLTTGTTSQSVDLSGPAGRKLIDMITSGLAAICTPLPDIHAQYAAMRTYAESDLAYIAPKARLVSDIGYVRGRPRFLAHLQYGPYKRTFDFHLGGNLCELHRMLNGFIADAELSAGRAALSK